MIYYSTDDSYRCSAVSIHNLITILYLIIIITPCYPRRLGNRSCNRTLRIATNIHRQIYFFKEIMAQSSNDHDQQLQQIREQYSSQKVISDAEAKLAEAGINAAQNVYQSAILDWVDDVTMGMDPEEEEEGGNASHGSGNAVLGPEAVTSSGARVVTKRDIIRGEIVELWLGYANLNRRANLVSPIIFFRLAFLFLALSRGVALCIIFV